MICAAARTTMAWLAMLLLLGAAPASARAQQPPPVSLEVLAGFDGAGQYRAGYWFPVTVIAANDGPDLQGVIEWRFPGNDEGPFRYQIDLPRGARKQVTFAVITQQSLRTAEVSLQSGGAALAGARVRMTPVTADQLAVGVVSSDPSLLNSLSTVQFTNGFATAVVRVRPDLLPERSELLSALDALFIHDLPTADLSEAQRAAIAEWVRLGGQLVVGGGPNADQTTAGLGDLLPVALGELRSEVPSAPLGQFARRNDLAVAVPSLTANAVSPLPEARALDQGQLLTSVRRGAGQVVFAAFDLEALRAWPGEGDLWARVVQPQDRMLIGQSLRSRGENLLRDTIQLGELQLPSPLLIFGLIVIYIVLIGPVNFLLLRRRGRSELAWVTTPILVLAFVALTYGASFALRGTRPLLSQLSLVQGFEGQPDGRATAFVGIFSPQRRSYNLGVESGALLSPGTFQGFQFSQATVTLSDDGASLQDLLVDVSSLRTLLVEQPAAEVPAVSSQLEISATQVAGSLTNQSGQTLREALLVVGSSAQALGDIAPGASADLSLSRRLGNFPGQISISTEGPFNRDQVLYSLFNYDRFRLGGPQFAGDKGLPEPGGVYLLAWVDGPALPVAIDGATADQQGATLYIIRLGQ